MELTPQEIRILGCLAEKEATTPDTYPLSTNALLMACNQRSSRDPVVHYEEDEVTRALVSLRERELVRTSREGGRVYKHAHLLRRALAIDDAELAVLAVLFLRGPQTSGELRARTERQHAFVAVEDVEGVLERLARREPPLTRRLDRRPGQKEPRWGHLVAGAEEGPAASLGPGEGAASTVRPDEEAFVLGAATTFPGPAAVEARPAGGAGVPGREEPAQLREELGVLREEVATLREELADLRARVDDLETLA